MTRELDQSLIQVADLSALSSNSLLINGFNNISQELGVSARIVTNSSGYITDQFILGTSTNIGASGQQIANPFSSQPDIPFGLKVAITTAYSTLAAGDYLTLAQPIEGVNISRLLYGYSTAKPVTIAFMAKSNINTTGYFSLRSLKSDGTTLRSYIAKFVLLANTDTFIYLNIPGDVAQSLLTTNVVSLYASWCFSCGSNYQATVNSWVSGNYVGGTDTTNLAASTSNSVVISGAVMFTGIIPISQYLLPVLARPIDDELRKCQRYYCQEMANGHFYAAAGQGSQEESPVYLPVNMRAIPSSSLVTAGSQNGNSNGYPGIASVPSNRMARFFMYASGVGDIYAINYVYAFNARM